MSRYTGVVVEVIDRDGSRRGKYRPFDGDAAWERSTRRAQAQALEDARIVDAAGRVITGKERQRVVDRLMLDTARMPPIFDPTAEEAATRALIPRLWNHGTVPAFIGPKGWGKTKLLFGEFAPALLIPDHRFLGAFEPAQMTDAERLRDIWMINSETRPMAVHEELIAGGLTFSRRDGVPCYVGPWGLDAGVLIVDHLPESGGATWFDLTDPMKADLWEARLLSGRHAPPLAVIADGVSAMLGNDTNRYGAFTSGFRRLLQEAGIPNGLGVLHSPMDPRVNTPMNGLESMGEWDGMWIARADRFPIFPATSRYFLTLPRLGDPIVPEGRVTLSDGGKLTLGAGSPASTQVGQVVGNESRRDRIRRKLTEGGGWMTTKAVCGSGEEYKRNKAELNVMLIDGEVESREVGGRSRGTEWQAVTAPSSVDIDTEA